MLLFLLKKSVISKKLNIRCLLIQLPFALFTFVWICISIWWCIPSAWKISAFLAINICWWWILFFFFFPLMSEEVFTLSLHLEDNSLDVEFYLTFSPCTLIMLLYYLPGCFVSRKESTATHICFFAYKVSLFFLTPLKIFYLLLALAFMVMMCLYDVASCFLCLGSTGFLESVGS